MSKMWPTVSCNYSNNDIPPVFKVKCKANASEFLALKPFKSEEYEFFHLKKNFHHKYKERLRQLDDYMTARVVILKPDEFVPVHPHEGDDTYTEKEGRAYLDTYTCIHSMKQYNLDSLEREKQPDSKSTVTLMFKADPEFKTKNSFLEIFPNTPKCVRYPINLGDGNLNKDTFEDNTTIIQCNVPTDDFKTCFEALKGNKIDRNC